VTAAPSRRRLLALAGGSLIAAPFAAAGAQLTMQGSAPPDVGRKFFGDGRVKGFAGNTVVCHLPQQGPGSEPFDALLDIYRQLPGSSFGKKMTALPPSSYHMTIFVGANDQERKPGLWPADLPLDLPMAACNERLAELLRSFRLDCALPFKMRVDTAEPAADERPLTIRLVPLDEAEAAKLARLRDRLSTLLGIRSKGHDTYRYHITLGYLIQWLTPAENADFRSALKSWNDDLARICPVIELGAPEYCTLEDMFAFKRQFFLS